jgi:ribose 1,5-bisphosphate isomerase
MDEFNKIIQDIKSLKIQGATNVALFGLKAMQLKQDYNSIKTILKTRPTEPCLQNAIKYAKEVENPKISYNYLRNMDKRVESIASKLIKKNSIIFTHCHSSTVIGALKLTNVKFSVNNTETRPLYQGRKTAKEIASMGIKINHYVDSAAEEAIKNSDIILLGADYINEKGNVYNKIGSYTISELAKKHKIPLFIITNSWKYSSKKLKIEERNPKEIWETNHKNITVKNPSFDLIPNKNIKKIVSELGVLSPKKFVKKVKKEYSWIK